MRLTRGRNIDRQLSRSKLASSALNTVLSIVIGTGAFSIAVVSSPPAVSAAELSDRLEHRFKAAIEAIRHHRYRRAHRHLRKLDRQNHSKSQTILGLLYENGLGVERNVERAAEYYKKAAGQGLAEAESRLGHLMLSAKASFEHEERDGIYWIKSAAEKGVAEAQLTLSKLFDEGKEVPANHSESLVWLRKAADQGNEEACRLMHKIPGETAVESKLAEANAASHQYGQNYRTGMDNLTKAWVGYADIVSEINKVASYRHR
ncbi:MAG: sel1 repeat family protein [Cyanobacteria bacterium]|nr:sel1 repeat family protein [Cyanobacteriota bacterium]